MLLSRIPAGILLGKRDKFSTHLYIQYGVHVYRYMCTVPVYIPAKLETAKVFLHLNLNIGMNKLNQSVKVDVDEKKRKRLERNRESARECRKRKKDKKLELKAQLARLEADNLQLRLKLQVGHESTDRMSKSAFITSQLEQMIKEGANESDIQRTIQELQERFSDYGRDRRSAIEFHISQLRRCLQPTQTTRAILWLISIVPQFHDPSSGEVLSKCQGEVANLWYSLLDEIKPTVEQKMQMIAFSAPNSEEHSDPFGDIDRSSVICETMLDRIMDIIGTKNDSLDIEMNNLQTILSARQIAKFILWFDQNPACMQMLEMLWPHISYANTTISNNTDQQDRNAKSGNTESAGDNSEDTSGSEDSD